MKTQRRILLVVGALFLALTVSWCREVEPVDQRSCRLISRWRARWHLTPASAAWIALSEPGAFIMERRMLLRIKARAEQAARPGLAQRR